MINASTLALLNPSSVPVRGVTAVAKTTQDALVVDPSHEELEIGCSAFVITVCKVTIVFVFGRTKSCFPVAVTRQAQQLATLQDKAINTLIRRHVAKIFQVDAEEEDESEMVISRWVCRISI